MSSAFNIPAGFVLVPREPTEQWAYRVIRHRQPNLEVGSKAWIEELRTMLWWHEAMLSAAPASWCTHCGCGNDTAGYAHTARCQRLAAPTPTQVAEAPKAQAVAPERDFAMLRFPEVYGSQAVVGEASEDIVDQLCRAQSNVTRMHTEYQGKAMSDEVYDVFATLRDERIPALKRAIRATLASPAPSAAPPQGADALREASKALLAVLPKPGSRHWNTYFAAPQIESLRAALAHHQAPQQGEPK